MTFSNAFTWMKICKFWLKFHWSLFPMVQINYIPASIQIMAWRQPGDKPLSESMMVSLLMHICVTSPQLTKYMYNLVHQHICEMRLQWLLGWQKDLTEPLKIPSQNRTIHKRRKTTEAGHAGGMFEALGSWKFNAGNLKIWPEDSIEWSPKFEICYSFWSA